MPSVVRLVFSYTPLLRLNVSTTITDFRVFGKKLGVILSQNVSRVKLDCHSLGIPGRALQKATGTTGALWRYIPCLKENFTRLQICRTSVQDLLFPQELSFCNKDKRGSERS